MMKKIMRGGARAGAGRKKIIEGNAHKITVKISEEAYNYIQRLAYSNRGNFVRDAIDERIEKTCQ